MKIRVSSLTFACYDASCRPPTSGGTGGSKAKGKTGNTSIVPSDPHPKVKAGDSHPAAPGADNLEAVRGYRGQDGQGPERRIPRQGETVDIYRDLGHGREHKRGFPDNDAFSVRLASGHSGASVSLVTASTVGIELTTGRPSWAQAAKREAEVAGKRGVHGFIRGEVRRYMSPSVATALAKQPGWEKVTYYPGAQDFFQPGTRKRFVGADRVILAKGEFFAYKPTFHNTTTPISPIEKRLGFA